MSGDPNLTSLHEALLQAGFTTNIQESVISQNLNASLFLALLMGIYTVAFVGTMYIYANRGVSNRYLVPTTLTIIYLCNLSVFGIQWYVIKWELIDNGESRDTVFISTLNPNAIMTSEVENATAITICVSMAFGLVLGDGLLIWRCYNLWNRSFRVIVVPLLLTFAEGVLMLVHSFAALSIPKTAASQAILNRLNNLASSSLLIASCTTIITTTLIAYRIHSFLKIQAINTTKFYHIVDVVVQSGAVYALALITTGLAGVLMQNGQALNMPLCIRYGISTTVMVAQVATLQSQNKFSIASEHRATGIQFVPHSTSHSDIMETDAAAASQEVGKAR
ncbi:hypothetical protein BDN70DRAFT_964896 [Pholiota conissans]|uniref:Uncharacterized protein n=1 Tax=Pholiota conissans TaxID=109636 RepID=A0A9P6CNG7_9AGAR|nr:hypothetical protein BDN70DRAFT_964896 [Pholiota conissans]